jgi:hypothetical protein
MKTYNQLSQAQKRVVDLLKVDQDYSYCKKAEYYNFQVIYSNNEHTWCTRPTLDSLINHKVLVRGHFDRYILSPSFSFDK